MLRSYLLALCSGSALDSTTNNFSLFNLVENLGLPGEALGQVLPFEMHLHVLVDAAARNAEFEARIVRVEEKGNVETGEAFAFRTGDGAHFRIRAGFRVPQAYGDYLLHAEWRRKGEEAWHADSAIWPLAVRPFAPPTPTPQQ